MANGRKQEWKEKVWQPATERSGERQARFETSSEIEVEPIYTPEDVSNQDYDRDLGFPGSFPYTRGVQPTMYRGRIWTMRQYSGFASAEETNRRYHYLLEQGQTGLSMAFDLPTQTGYDSDHPIAYSEVGRVGVPISHLEDMETVFEGINLAEVSTSMTINATASLLLAYYIAMAKKQGVDPKELRGTVQNDILKEYIARGTHIYPAAPSMRLVTDLFAYCASETPNWNTISISGYHMREAGCTAAQEVGFTLANAMAYVRAAVNAGLSVDDFAPQLTFFFVAQSNLMEEVAKFRAARRLWARLMKERFNSQNPRSQMMRFHAQTAGVTLTAQQPDNNVVRSSIQALAAILGGTQSLHVNSKDEALALPTEGHAGGPMRLVTDLFAYCASETPNWNTISISGYHMREAGCTAAQEVGFTLANAMAYVRAAVNAGLSVDDFAPQLTFFFVAQSNLMEEVAKFRAARRLWARLMKERFNSQNPRSQMMRFHAQTAGVTLTAQQPDNNVVRSSIQALAAILGGTQSLHVNSKDEALALPTEESVTLSLRTQQVLAFECGLTDTVDPLAGSYYVEKLTDDLERAALHYIAEVDELGGAVPAIDEGYQQREIGDAAYKMQLEIEDGQHTVVGVNAYQNSEEPTIDILRIDPAERQRQIARLQRVRSTRNGSRVAAALANLEMVARSNDNTMPAILECVEAYCTTGEICNVFRSVFGVQQDRAVV